MLEGNFSRSLDKEALATTTSNTAVLPPPVTLSSSGSVSKEQKPVKRQGFLSKLFSSGNMIISGQGYPSSGMLFHLDIRTTDESD